MAGEAGEQNRIAKLEACVRELRAALERNAHPEFGWNNVEDADAFEDSRDLVPNDDVVERTRASKGVKP